MTQAHDALHGRPPTRQGANATKVDGARLWTACLYLLVATTIWGVMFPLAKRVLPHVDAFGLTLIRYGLAAVAMYPVLYAREGAAAVWPRGQMLKAFLYGTAGFAGFSLLAFTGLKQSSPAHGAILAALMPLITAIITAVQARRLPSQHTLAGIGLALCGVGLVVSDGDLAAMLASRSAGGDAMILGGVLCWVIYTLGARSFPGWSLLRYSTVTMGLGMFGVLLVSLAALAAGLTRVPAAADLATVAPELVFIALVSVPAVFGWNEGVRRLGAVNGALFINFVPISALALQAAMGEVVDGWEIAGGALVIFALVLNNLMQRRLAAAAMPTVPRAALAGCRS